LCEKGGKCSCLTGYQLAGDDKHCQDVDECLSLADDDKHCQDIDECLSDNGGCSEICVNLPGSYTCACGTGKEISEDKRSCTVVDKCLIENGGCEHLCEKGGKCSRC
jgi:hypothetical protein